VEGNTGVLEARPDLAGAAVPESPAARATPAGAAARAGTSARADTAPRPRLLAPRRIAVAATLVVFVVAWDIWSRFMPPVLVPGPAQVAARFVAMWSDPGFIGYAVASLYHVAAAVTIAFTLGVAIALAAYFRPILKPPVYARLAPFLNSFSGIGWAFLALIWFGINDGAVIFASSVALLPLAIINAGAGLAELNRETIEMAVSFSRSGRRRTTFVILPMLFPYLFATLRLCIGIGWQIVLTVELLCGSGGLGTIVNMSRARYATDMVFAVVVLVLLIVFVSDRLIFAKIQARLRKSYEV
jgi:ABC-type nitrate/sulfonate/bicarbonate transport system permease component